MNSFLQRMREELVRRNYAENTIRSYLRIVRRFRAHCGKRLDRLGPDDLRSYHAHLLEERKLAVRMVVQHVAAIRFLYAKTLRRRDMKEDLPYPRNDRRRLPVVLSPEEALRLIDSARNLFHRAMLMTLYSCGLRRTELCRLKVSDIDSKRMMIRIEQGKGNVDREVPLSPKLLETLRLYWRWMRPKTYLFPGTEKGWRAGKPIASRVVWEAVQFAAARAKLDKHVTPHTLRHSYATDQLEAGIELKSMQLLLGMQTSRQLRCTCTFPRSTCKRFRHHSTYDYDPIENRATLAPSTQT